MKIALVDDHVLLREALASVINTFPGVQVIFTATNGKELIKFVQDGLVPDMILLDLNMPNMDGYETAHWLKINVPQTAILVLTMFDTELTLIKLLQLGVRGFLKKDILPVELKQAINAVEDCGYYYNHSTTGRLLSIAKKDKGNISTSNPTFSENELKFLKLASSELTYKQVAEIMEISPRTVDNYRDALFEKLNVKSRVGMALYAFKNGIV